VRYNVNISEVLEEGASESNHMPPAAPEAEHTEEPEEQAEPETEEQTQPEDGQKEPEE